MSLPWSLALFSLCASVALSQTPVTEPAPPPAPANWPQLTAEQRLADLHERRTADVKAALEAKGFALGDAVFIRVIKEMSVLELWLRAKGQARYTLYRSFYIARWSGELGPKQKEGDNQAPEGCYSITRSTLNPKSNYHLSFNIGYPNAFDTALKRTGSFIMIHGKNVSLGCFAMTDPGIEHIYLIVEAALNAGQKEVAVHCFPFRMTDERLAQAADSPWHDFWSNLKQGWDRFEQTGRVPRWQVKDGRYAFE